MSVRTAEGKRIRFKWLQIERSIAAGIAGEWTGLDWRVPDDIRIQGVFLHLRIGLPDAPDVEEGLVDASASFGQGTYTDGNNALIWTSARMINVVEVAYESMLNDATRERTLMFPEGYGIDVDEGEVWTLWHYLRQTILSAGNATVTVVAQIYYVER